MYGGSVRLWEKNIDNYCSVLSLHWVMITTEDHLQLVPSPAGCLSCLSNHISRRNFPSDSQSLRHNTTQSTLVVLVAPVFIDVLANGILSQYSWSVSPSSYLQLCFSWNQSAIFFIFIKAAFQVIHQSAGFIRSDLVQPVFQDFEK